MPIAMEILRTRRCRRHRRKEMNCRRPKRGGSNETVKIDSWAVDKRLYCGEFDRMIIHGRSVRELGCEVWEVWEAAYRASIQCAQHDVLPRSRD